MANEIAEKILPAQKSDERICKGKQTASFSLSLQSIVNIDEFLHEIKKQLPLNKRRRLYRSTFIELMLNLVFADYAKYGDESAVWQIVMHWAEEE